jgi:predicted transposase YbfD/YdcC
VIKVYRKVYRNKNKGPAIETAYFISSLSCKETAKTFHYGIRGHWLIENSLHYVKDVTFNEDGSKTRTGNAPQNISVIRNFGINMLRRSGYNNIKQAIRMVSNDIKAIARLLN